MRTPRERLQEALRRINHASAELRLQPESFQATVLLDLTAADLAIVLAELFPENDDEERAAVRRRRTLRAAVYDRTRLLRKLIGAADAAD